MNRKLRVFICHWHGNYRRSLRSVLEQLENRFIIDEGEEYPDCMEWLEKNAINTDIVLIGFPSWVNDSVRIVREFVAEFPNIRFIKLSLFETETMEDYYRRAGIYGCFDETGDINKLYDIILKQHE
ncbi:MAG: hypothetical protein HUJ25_07720 [Crocinitomicaceae bacterium]|nr:hypothetical protein [Crocinitomicaceae bacterium]